MGANGIPPVRLGLLPPLTGLVGMYGTEITRAASIACEQINESGGVLGRPLELVVEDDGSLPESAVAAAEKLLDRHNCVALVGNLLSNSRIAVAYRVAEPRRIPYLNFSFYEGSILSPYFFHFAALPNQQIDRMIPYMRAKYGPRMFFAGNNYEWPRGSVHAAKEALTRIGGEVVGEEYCPIGMDSATTERLLDHIADAAPDVLVPYFAGADQVSFLTRFTERGLKNRMAVVMGHYDEIMTSRLPATVRDGFYSSNTYFMSVDTAENRDVLARLSKLPGVRGIWPEGDGILTNFGEGAYVCVRAFAKAANQAGSVDSQALIGALKTIEVSAPQGTVRMLPSHHHASVNTYLARSGADGRFAIIQKFGAIEPTLPERYSHQRIDRPTTLEEDFRLQARMLGQMSEAIFLIGTTDKTIIYANKGAERMYGHVMKEMLGQPVELLGDPSDQDRYKNFADILSILTRKGEWQGEIRTIGKDAQPLWCSLSISTFTHPFHGEVWLAVATDITERVLAEQEMRKSLVEKETLLREVHHRVKNNLQIISSLLYFESQKIRGQAGEAAFTDVRNRLNAMTLVHEKLYQSKNLSQIEFVSYVQSLLREIERSNSGRSQQITVQITGETLELPIEKALPCGMIVNELTTNVYKYAFPNGRSGILSVQISHADGRATIVIGDDGVGMPADFDPDRGTSFGWRLIKSLVEQIDGAVTMTRDRGTVVTISMPYQEPAG